MIVAKERAKFSSYLGNLSDIFFRHPRREFSLKTDLTHVRYEYYSLLLATGFAYRFVSVTDNFPGNFPPDIVRIGYRSSWIFPRNTFLPIRKRSWKFRTESGKILNISREEFSGGNLVGIFSSFNKRPRSECDTEKILGKRTNKIKCKSGEMEKVSRNSMRLYACI